MNFIIIKLYIYIILYGNICDMAPFILTDTVIGGCIFGFHFRIKHTEVVHIFNQHLLTNIYDQIIKNLIKI